MKRARWVIVILVVCVGAIWTWNSLRSHGRAMADGAGKPGDNGSDGRSGDGRESNLKGFERLTAARRNPRSAIEELEAKYRGLAIGELKPGSPEYNRFNGDCYLLRALNLEEADDLLASWFVRADEEEESLEKEWNGRGIYPSLQALTLIRRPRRIVLDRILARTAKSNEEMKQYSWSTHLARRFQGDREALDRLEELLATAEGIAIGRYSHLMSAVKYGSWGPKGPPDASRGSE